MSKLVPQKVGPVDKRRRPRGLTRAIRTAIDAIVFDRCTRAEACEKAGITERALYLALEKAEVAGYWNGQLHVLRQGSRAETLHRLFDLRSQDRNAAAAVKACQVLEQLHELEPIPAARSRIPGVVIRIVSAPPVRDPSPVLEFDPTGCVRPATIDVAPEQPTGTAGERG